MNPQLKKALKYLYIVFAVLFLVIFYGNEPEWVIALFGLINTVVFVFLYLLIFRNRSEKRWVNVLSISAKILVILVALLFPFVVNFLTYSACLELTRSGLYQNIVTKEIALFGKNCTNHRAPWYYTELPWGDPRNPYPNAPHGTGIIEL